jgi:hypothetical protein
MKIEWIDGFITPSLFNTNVRLLTVKNGQLSLAIFTPSDGWFDILSGALVSAGTYECYARIQIPHKNVTTKTITSWE